MLPTTTLATIAPTTTRAMTHHHRRNHPFRFGDGSAYSGREGSCTIASRLFTFVISLVVVGIALAIATRVALHSEPQDSKPATADDECVGAPGDSRGLTPTRARRVRSAVLLVTLLTALGAAAALVLIVAGAILLSGIRTAVQ